MKLISHVLLLLGLCISSLGAQDPLSPAEISAIEATATSFAKAFKDGDEERLRTLLVTRTVLEDLVPASISGQFSHEEIVEGNVLRFKEWRGAFGDLKRYDPYWTITVTPGKRRRDKQFTSAALIKNSFVELRYGNRIRITLKIEDMIVAGDRSYILAID